LSPDDASLGLLRVAGHDFVKSESQPLVPTRLCVLVLPRRSTRDIRLARADNGSHTLRRTCNASLADSGPWPASFHHNGGHGDRPVTFMERLFQTLEQAGVVGSLRASGHTHTAICQRGLPGSQNRPPWTCQVVASTLKQPCLGIAA